MWEIVFRSQKSEESKKSKQAYVESQMKESGIQKRLK